MARIVVCGGSVIGLSVAMMLAADGHQVTVLEADPAVAPTPPVAAWEAWRRKGVARVSRGSGAVRRRVRHGDRT